MKEEDTLLQNLDIDLKFVFDFEKMTTSGRQIFIDKELVYPGETVEAEITMLSPHFFEGKLYEGIEFKFCEGSKIIGNGKILKILNEKLKRIDVTTGTKDIKKIRR